MWRSIKTDNTAFRARVACMKGYVEILSLMGYTEVGNNSLQFPEYVLEPDKPKLYIIAAELLMAKLELEQLNQQQPSQGATHLSSYGYTERMMSREEKFQSYALGGQQVSSQLQTTGTVYGTTVSTTEDAIVANQQLKREEIHHRDQTSSASDHSHVGHRTQHRGYSVQQDFNVQHYSDAPTTLPVAYHG